MIVTTQFNLYRCTHQDQGKGLEELQIEECKISKEIKLCCRKKRWRSGQKVESWQKQRTETIKEKDGIQNKK